MKKPFLILLVLISILAMTCCNCGKQQGDPLPSWNETYVKKSLIDFITISAKDIPEEDRVAVFDMDGTLACEKPLWFEMYVAINGLNEQSAKNPELLKDTAYLFAKKLSVNSEDTSVLNFWNRGNGSRYIDSMVWKAYMGTDHETYIDSARSLLSRLRNDKFDRCLGDLFYQPMLELIQLLKDNKFEVYVVSGSVRGVIWSVCPQVLKLNRDHLIGTNQILEPVYKPLDNKTSFIIKKGIFKPRNNVIGKSLNIYSQIGKMPVFAFGNTTGDFGMFHLTATSKYPHVEYMLNHDNDSVEYKYNPYYGAKPIAWEDSLKNNNWVRVDMSKEFKVVWRKGQ